MISYCCITWCVAVSIVEREERMMKMEDGKLEEGKIEEMKLGRWETWKMEERKRRRRLHSFEKRLVIAAEAKWVKRLIQARWL